MGFNSGFKGLNSSNYDFFFVNDVYCVLKHFTAYFSFCTILIVSSSSMYVVPLNSEAVVQKHIKRRPASN